MWSLVSDKFGFKEIGLSLKVGPCNRTAWASGQFLQDTGWQLKACRIWRHAHLDLHWKLGDFEDPNFKRKVAHMLREGWRAKQWFNSLPQHQFWLGPGRRGPQGGQGPEWTSTCFTARKFLEPSSVWQAPQCHSGVQTFSASDQTHLCWTRAHHKTTCGSPTDVLEQRFGWASQSNQNSGSRDAVQAPCRGPARSTEEPEASTPGPIPHLQLRFLHSTLYTWHFTLHTLHSRLCTPHFTLYNLHFILHNPHFTPYTLHSPLNTALSSHAALRTPLHSTVYTGTVTREECTRLLKSCVSTSVQLIVNVFWAIVLLIAFFCFCCFLLKSTFSVLVSFLRLTCVWAFGFVGGILFNRTKSRIVKAHVYVVLHYGSSSADCTWLY